MNGHQLGIIAGVLLLAATPAAAQRIDSPYRFIDTNQFLNVYAGYVSASEGPLQAGPQSAPIVGARWAIRVSGPFQLGAEAAYVPSTRTVRDTVFIAADSAFAILGESDMHILTLMGNLRLNITGSRTWNRLQPFAVLGAGAAIDLAGTPAVEAEMARERRFDFGTSFAGQFGAGVEYFPGQRVSARLDARNMLWRLRVPDAFARTGFGGTLASADWENNFVVSAGLSFHF